MIECNNFSVLLRNRRSLRKKKATSLPDCMNQESCIFSVSLSDPKIKLLSSSLTEAYSSSFSCSFYSLPHSFHSFMNNSHLNLFLSNHLHPKRSSTFLPFQGTLKSNRVQMYIQECQFQVWSLFGLAGSHYDALTKKMDSILKEEMHWL
jgi:hypothetical protein